jgi:hypothetical protein
VIVISLERILLRIELDKCFSFEFKRDNQLLKSTFAVYLEDSMTSAAVAWERDIFVVE